MVIGLAGEFAACINSDDIPDDLHMENLGPSLYFHHCVLLFAYVFFEASFGLATV